MATTVEVLERPAMSPKFVDISGRVNQYGVKFVRHLGFGRKQDGTIGKLSVWVCRCPKCGVEYHEWRTQIASTKSCNACKRLPNTHEHNLRYERWKRCHGSLLAKNSVAGEWEDHRVFIRDMIALETSDTGGARTIEQIDSSRGLSPDNYKLTHRADHVDPTSTDDLLEILGNSRHWRLSRNSPEVIIKAPAAHVILGLTRQRIQQMPWDLVQERLEEAADSGMLDDLFDAARSGNNQSAINDVDIAIAATANN